jgi:hypothetical protein
MIITFVGVVICGLAGGGLAVVANEVVERWPQTELLVWAVLAGALAAVIWIAIARMPAR